MFSAALGLIGGIGSIVMGGQQYALGMQELALKREALQQQRDFGMLNYGLSMDQLRKEDEQVDYIKKMNERNQIAQALERAKIEQQRQQRLQAYQDERQYVLDRQIEIDRAQAEQYALELEAFLSNRDIAQDERDLALSYLEQARSIASGERDEDLRQLRLERLTAQQERDFAISEMRNAQAIAASERDQDLQYRDSINSQINEMGMMLEQAYGSMGQLVAPRGATEAEIMDTIGRYEQNAVANVDRAADRVASQAEATLIDTGMSRSTAGNRRRAEITSQIAQQYDNARLAARNQAMEYIKGRDALKDADFNRQLSGRERTFAEIAGIYAPVIQGLVQNRQTLSANSYQTPVQIGSGNVIRQVQSANDYNAPVQIGSAIFSPTGMSGRMGSTLNTPSVADAYVITGDYNQFQPQNWQLTSPSGYMGNASQLIGDIAGRYTPSTYMEMGQQNMGAGFTALGSALNDMHRSGWGRQQPQASGYRRS